MFKGLRRYPAGAAIVSILFCPLSIAQYDGGASIYIGAGPPLIINDLNQRMLENIGGGEKQSRSSEKVPPKSPVVSTRLELNGTAATEQILKFMASSYPPEQRRSATELFKSLLEGYKNIEQQFGLPPNDMGTAVAAFLAGSYMAYHNEEFPDAKFRPLALQMQQVVARNPSFVAASSADRQEAFTQLAVLGMFMATTQMALQKTPDVRAATNMRSAAESYIQQFLKVEISQMHITAEGLVLNR